MEGDDVISPDRETATISYRFGAPRAETEPTRAIDSLGVSLGGTSKRMKDEVDRFNYSDETRRELRAFANDCAVFDDFLTKFKTPKHFVVADLPLESRKLTGSAKMLATMQTFERPGATPGIQGTIKVYGSEYPGLSSDVEIYDFANQRGRRERETDGRPYCRPAEERTSSIFAASSRPTGPTSSLRGRSSVPFRRAGAGRCPFASRSSNRRDSLQAEER